MDALGTFGSFPKNIGDVTTSISKGADSLDKMVVRMDSAAQASGTNAAKKTQTFCDATQSVKQSLQDLQNCQEVMTTSALVVNAVVDSCSGHFHPRAVEQVLTKFDGQWDSWAKTVNGIYQQVSPTGQANILESLAKGGFGDNIFYLGSAIKNEAAGIFGGIADFEDALHVFKGSYRNPLEAAKKIEQGVKGIINATERVANSINNTIKTYQKGMGHEVTGNPILSYLGNLHNTKVVSAVNKVLTIGGGAATMVTDAASLSNALKSKDPRTIFSAGKKTIDDAKTIYNGLKNAGEAKKVTSLAAGATGGTMAGSAAGTATGGTAPTNAQAAAEQPQQNDEKNDGANTDSYVCSGATMKCTFGDRKAKLTVYPDRTVFLTGQPMANISDHTSLYNIAPFGKCHTTSYPPTGKATAAAHGRLTPMPCVPGTNSNWMNGKNDYIIKGDPALLKSSFCRCCYGGVITITDDGQRDTGSADLSRALLLPKEQLNSNAEEKSKLDVDSVLDGIQTALDFAGFIPMLGAAPDLLNAGISAMRGDFLGAGLNLLAAVPVIGDSVKAAVIAKRGLGSAVAVANLTKGTKIANKGQRRAKLAKEASKFIGTEVSTSQLIKSGMSKSDADFFMKKVRYQRREAARTVYEKSPNVDMFAIESHLNAIDFAHPIEVGVMPKGNRLGMYINKDIKGSLGSPGNYSFNISPGSAIPTTDQLGVAKQGIKRFEIDRLGNVKPNSENYIFKKEYHEVELTEDMPYIKSTARKITDTWSDKMKPKKLPGGAEQIFLQDKNSVLIVK